MIKDLYRNGQVDGLMDITRSLNWVVYKGSLYS